MRKKINILTIIFTKKCSWCSVLFITIMSVMGCGKENVSFNPYTNKVEPKIKFLDIAPSPSSGYSGTNATFYVRGLGTDTSAFKFYINQIPTTVISIKDSAITVKIPLLASTGAASVVVNGESYFGPDYSVVGNVSIDNSFKVGTGVGVNSINDIFLRTDNTYFLVGDFKDYNGNATLTAPINGIVQINADGTIKSSSVGKGADGGNINSIAFNSNYYFLGGSFNKYNVRQDINNMTRILPSGALDTTIVDIINLNPIDKPKDSKDTVPQFNGGFDRQVVRIFNDDDQLVCLGNYSRYFSYYYYRSTVTNLVRDNYQIGQVARLNIDGTIDSSYNYAPATNTGNKGANGFFTDAVQLPNGTIIFVGNFTTYNGQSIGRIGALTETGLLDATFNKGKTGADGDINKITYNTTTNKLMVTGIFKHYNGVVANGVALLNVDGSIDASFSFRNVLGGVPNYAAQISTGMVVVSGSFTQYDNIYRQGLLFLNKDGSIAAGYNTMGAFVGQINEMIESTSSLGNKAIIIVGKFSVIDNKTAGGIAKIEIL